MSAFFDTNVLVYAFTVDPKQRLAQEILAGGGLTSAQVLNEFTNVARAKHRRSWDDICAAIGAVRLLVDDILPLTSDTHATALNIASTHNVPFYDALIVASALEGGCDVLLSEDFQHGRMFATLRVENPFL